jgi:hypothetical protein
VIGCIRRYCECGWDERECQREQNIDGDAVGHARRMEMRIDHCPDCDELTHASEGEGDGRCARCRACHYCDHEETRTGIARGYDDNARVLKVCEECGEDSDRAEKHRKFLVDNEWI